MTVDSTPLFQFGPDRFLTVCPVPLCQIRKPWTENSGHDPKLKFTDFAFGHCCCLKFDSKSSLARRRDRDEYRRLGSAAYTRQATIVETCSFRWYRMMRLMQMRIEDG